MFDEKTPHLKLPLPVRGNQLMNDVGRIRESFTILNQSVATAMQGASDAEHFAEEARDTAQAARTTAGEAMAVAESKATADDVQAHNNEKEAHGATAEAEPGRIPVRDSDGNFAVGSPRKAGHAANREYVTTLLADAEATMKEHVADEVATRVPLAPNDGIARVRRNDGWEEALMPNKYRCTYGEPIELDGDVLNWTNTYNATHCASWRNDDGSVYTLFRTAATPYWRLVHFAVTGRTMKILNTWTNTANPAFYSSFQSQFGRSLAARNGHLYFFFFGSSSYLGVARIALGEGTFTWADAILPESTITGLSLASAMPDGSGIIVGVNGNLGTRVTLYRYDFINDESSPAPEMARTDLNIGIYFQAFNGAGFSSLDDSRLLMLGNAPDPISTGASTASHAVLADVRAPGQSNYMTLSEGLELGRWRTLFTPSVTIGAAVQVTEDEGLFLWTSTGASRYPMQYAARGKKGVLGQCSFRFKPRWDLTFPAGTSGTSGFNTYPTCYMPGEGIVMLSTRGDSLKSLLIPVNIS